MAGSGTLLAAENGSAAPLGRRPTMKEMLAQRRKDGGCREAAPIVETPVVDFLRAQERLTSSAGVDPVKISDRLKKLYRLGGNPRVRLTLYYRLDAIVERHGQDAYDVIKSVVDDAVGMDNPDRWFCHSVLLRLKERGFGTKGKEVAVTWEKGVL